MDLVNAVCTMLSFGSVAAWAIFLAQQKKKKLKQRNEEIMSTISAIQYSQLREHKNGNDNRDDGLRDDVSKCANDPDSSKRNHNRNYKCS